MHSKDEKKWILICDESGAKGFNNKPATNDDPIGIVAGLLITEVDYLKLKSEVLLLRAKYETPDNKFHVTDLEESRQNELRESVFELIKKSNGVIVYEAISQDGFHEWYKIQNDYWNKLKADGKKRGYGYSFSDHKERLHSTLFLGCFLRALAHIGENEDPSYNFDFDLLTDTMDTPVLEEIEAKILHYLGFKQKVKEQITAKRYNHATKAVETKTGIVEYDIKIPQDQDIGDLTGVNLTIKIDNVSDIIADMLSNSIAYYLKKSFTEDNSILLSSIEAISDHPLSAQIVSLTPEGGYDLNQALYQFPVPADEIRSEETRMPQDFATNITFSESD